MQGVRRFGNPGGLLCQPGLPVRVPVRGQAFAKVPASRQDGARKSSRIIVVCVRCV
jgi:hypothetical protein